ncbi:MAG: radical SAM protein [bacterium]|nr:radical SAM protein [bacterium]
MKIMLISLPKIKALFTEIPSIFGEEPQYYPPLDLMFIAAYLKKYSHHEVEILDTQILRMGYKEIRQEIETKSPDVVGMTTTTYTLPEAIAIAKIVKEINSSIHVTLGGTHTYIFSNETIRFESIDSLIVGEGEIVFTLLVNCLDQDRSKLHQIKGIIYKDNGRVIQTPAQDVIFDLDSLPFPQREMIPYKKYLYQANLLNSNIFTTILSSRGCPYECIYCYRPPFSKNFRARSNANVINEIEECVQLGIQEFIFVDDVFTLNRKRVFEFCDEIIKRNLKIKWRIKARVNNIDYGLLLKLREAGCIWIHYELGTGTQRMLDLLKKEFTVEQIQSAIKLTNDVRITSSVDIMFGFPEETKEDILKTIKFVNKLNPDFAYFSLIIPHPNTEIYKIWLSNSGIKKDLWQEYVALNSEFKIPVWHQNPDELTNLLKFAYKSFYFRLGFFLKHLLTAPSLGVFKNRIKISMKALKSEMNNHKI